MNTPEVRLLFGARVPVGPGNECEIEREEDIDWLNAAALMISSDPSLERSCLRLCVSAKNFGEDPSAAKEEILVSGLVWLRATSFERFCSQAWHVSR